MSYRLASRNAARPALCCVIDKRVGEQGMSRSCTPSALGSIASMTCRPRICVGLMSMPARELMSMPARGYQAWVHNRQLMQAALLAWAGSSACIPCMVLSHQVQACNVLQTSTRRSPNMLACSWTKQYSLCPVESIAAIVWTYAQACMHACLGTYAARWTVRCLIHDIQWCTASGCVLHACIYQRSLLVPSVRPPSTIILCLLIVVCPLLHGQHQARSHHASSTGCMAMQCMC